MHRGGGIGPVWSAGLQTGVRGSLYQRAGLETGAPSKASLRDGDEFFLI